MKNPNGYGSVDKLPGNRRKPYRIRITDGWELNDSGKAVQLQKTLGTYATREEALEALSLYNKNPYAFTQSVTFAEVYERWSASRYPALGKESVNSYTRSYKLCEPLHGLQFNKLRLADLQTMLDKCNSGGSVKTRTKVFLSQLYDYAIKNDICDKDYAQYIDLSAATKAIERRQHIPFSLKEINKLWEHQNDYDVQTILILIYSGVRIGELIDLKRENVHLEERYFDVISSKTEAGIRRVPIAEKTFPFWQQRMSTCYNTVLAGPKGKKVTYSNLVGLHFNTRLEELGFDTPHTPHDTRHTCISLLAEAKVPKNIIQLIVGHSGGDVTDKVYTHISVKTLVEAINSI